MSGYIRRLLGQARARVQRLLTESDDALQPDAPLQLRQLGTLITRLSSARQSLNERNDQYADYYATLETEEDRQAEDAHLAAHLDGPDGVLAALDNSDDALIRLRDLQQRLQEAPAAPNDDENNANNAHGDDANAYNADAADANGDPDVNVAPAGRKVLSARLPKVEIPCFDGCIENWKGFWDIFKVTVHDRPISNVQKFSYLVGRLKGVAANAVAGIPPSEQNYPEVVALLHDRFGRDELLVQDLYAQLIACHSCIGGDLRTVYDCIQKVLRQLRTFNQEVNSPGLLTQIMQKFPPTIIKRLRQLKETTHPYSTWTTTLFLQFINEYIRIEEDSDYTFSEKSVSRKPEVQTSKVHPREQKQRLYNNVRPTTDTFRAERYGQLKHFVKNPCVFCEGQHYNAECTSVKSYDHRRKIASQKKLCFRCLKPGHSASQCQSTQRCYICKTPSHATALCPQSHTAVVPSPQITAYADSTEVGPTHHTISSSPTLLNTGETVIMQLAKTSLRNPVTGAQATVNLILDSGSVRSYVLGSTAEQVGLQSIGTPTTMVVSVFGTTKTQTFQSNTVKFELSLKDGSQFPVFANTTQEITNPVSKTTVGPKDMSFLHSFSRQALAYSNYDFPESVEVNVLIGLDYFWDLVDNAKIRLPSGIYLVQSRLGYLLTGKQNSSATRPLPIASGGSVLFTSDIHCFKSLEQFWDLESLGIRDSPVISDDEKALEIFNQSVQFNDQDNRYYVNWIWKEDGKYLPDNKDHPGSNNERNSRIGTAEFKSDTLVLSPPSSGLNRIESDNKTTHSIRCIRQASKYAPSLNESLYRGPVLLPNLCGLLLRFRIPQVAILADIEKAFLQIALHPQERDVTRFFWYADANNPNLDGNIILLRFARVLFGIICSPFLLEAVIKYHLLKHKTTLALEILKNIYVDNVLIGASTKEEANQIYLEAKALFASASMNLREWTSNSSEMIAAIPEVDRCKASSPKVLGLTWHLADDTIALPDLNISSTSTTKRGVLKALASFYDPLGYFSPASMPLKVFLQKLWLKSLSWDASLPPDLQEEWNRLADSIKLPSHFRIPRSLGYSSTCTNTLIAFADASAQAYGAVVYLHSGIQGTFRVNIMMAKCRLPPKPKNGKPVTIPRLELLATLVGSRLLKFVHKELGIPISSQYLFTDSACVLHWLQTSRPLSVFVENRVKEIKDSVGVSIRHVSTSTNPADLLSRGQNASSLCENRLWWHGPAWIRQQVWTWPRFATPPTPQETEPDVDTEFRKDKTTTTLATHNEHDKSRSPFDIDETRYSSLHRLLRVTFACLRAVNRLRPSLKPRYQGIDLPSATKSTPTASEQAILLRVWLMHVQHRHFPEVFAALIAKRRHQLQVQLNLYEDEYGLLRSKGRIENAEVASTAKNPILLPNDFYLTKLIIRAVHEKLFHAGVNHTLTQLRSEYWVIKGRQQVRSVLTNCVTCQRYNGSPFNRPIMPPLPWERVRPSTPFTFIGLDYLGPFAVKRQKETRKAWICLFTCLAVRAIHLEVVEDLSSVSFISCIRRFISRRGCPEKILSDNAPQCKTVKTVLDRLWLNLFHDETVLRYFSDNGVSWQFTTELSPWKAGFYERLIGMVKQTLRKAVGQCRLSIPDFTTLVVNSRPLTYVSSDPEGFLLTPAHFLTQRATIGLPPLREDHHDLEYSEKKDAATAIAEQWSKIENCLQMFWKVWSADYLLRIRERSPFHRQRRHTAGQPKVGQIVLLRETTDRGTWRFGRIQKVLPSASDQKIRTVQVLLPTKRLVLRDVSDLVPLELHQLEERPDNDCEMTMVSISSGNDIGTSGLTFGPGVS